MNKTAFTLRVVLGLIKWIGISILTIAVLHAIFHLADNTKIVIISR